MNGIHSRREELLDKANISFISEALQNGKFEKADSENILIDIEKELYESLSSLSFKLPKEDGEKMMIDMFDYKVAIQNRYFTYGIECGARLLSELAK